MAQDYEASEWHGKIGVHLVESESDVSRLVQNSGHSESEFVVQDFYFGPAYSAEVWRDTEREIFFGVTNRVLSKPPFFTEKVKSFPWDVNSDWEGRVRDWVFELLRALDYTLGQAHVEFIDTSEGFKLVEINARMAGAMITPGILHVTNFNPYAMAVNQALGMAPTSETSREIKGAILTSASMPRARGQLRQCMASTIWPTIQAKPSGFHPGRLAIAS